MEELTQQMMNAYTDSTFAFSHIVSKCHTIETDILYQKRLNNLQPETYSPKICSEPQPTRNAVEKELMDEANQKYYRLFWGNKSAKKKYVSDNIESVYNERLRHWGEVVTYFGYVESVIKAKKDKEFHEKYIQEKTNLENHLLGPDSYVKKQLNEILNDLSFASDSGGRL